MLFAPVAGGGLAYLGNALAHLLQWFTPHHVDIGVSGGHFDRGVGGAGEVDRQLLYRLDQGQVVFDVVVGALVVERFMAGPGVTQYL
ncbi:hypothetical protein D3C80_1517000 [compost metagenome]